MRSTRKGAGPALEGRTIRVGVRLLKEDAAWLKARALSHGISLSDELRVLVRKIVKLHEEGGTFGDL